MKFGTSFDSTIKTSGSLAGSAADFGPYLIHNAVLTDLFFLLNLCFTDQGLNKDSLLKKGRDCVGTEEKCSIVVKLSNKGKIRRPL